MTAFPKEWTIGTAGHGAGSPSPTRNRPDRCVSHGHPGVTFHPQMNKTWCLCGEVIRDGEQVDWDFKGPGHPLMDRRDENGEWPIDHAPIICRIPAGTDTCRAGLDIGEHNLTAHGWEHPTGLDARGYWAFGERAVQ